MVIVDAVACSGEFALYASRRIGPKGRVLMLEPDSQNVAIAQRLFDHNGGWPVNVTLVPKGLWRTAGTLQFAAGLGQCSVLLEGAGEAVQWARHALSRGEGRVVDLDVVNLPSLVSEFGLHRLDLVKMDIEGAEIEAIEGAAGVMQTLRPRFSIASYHRRDGRRTCDLLEPMFRAAGYHVRTAYPVHLTTYAAADPLPATIR
jgi:FkbM family methyltransferase